MATSSIMHIVGLCRRIDETARDVYATLSRLSDSDELVAFWMEMSEEEAEHVGFWKHVQEVGAASGLPEVFDDPERVASELESALVKSRDLLARCEEDFSVAKAFTLAYRMEFFLLHPAFEVLFHSLGPSAGGETPEEDYDQHIDKFIHMLGKHGNVTPELELLGETLERLWRDNRLLALQSTHDDLTGVFNRRGFLSFSLQLAHLAQRNGSTIGVMMIDLDRFKEVNDRHGHAAGDRVLKATADLLSERIRASDIVGRYGGEEFIVLLPQVSPGATVNLAESIRRSIEESRPESIPVTTSVGVAEARIGQSVSEDYLGMIQHADEALYRAKEAGRNRVVEYTSTGQEPATGTEPVQ